MGRFGNVRGNAHREEWGMAVEVDDGLFRIRLNNPVSSLMVNTYAYRNAYRGAGELLIIDPGWPWTLDALEQALRDLGLARSFGDVDAWLYTHTHVDHMGGAALISEVSTSPHYTWSAVRPFVDEWHRFQDRFNDWTLWGERAFADREFAQKLAESTRARRAKGVEFLVEAHGEKRVRNVRFLDFGEEFEISDLRLRFLDGRGHDPYHGAFFEPDRGWLFAGDVVLATPTPISRPMEDDVELYMEALDRLEALPTTLLLPGHGVQRSGDLSSAFERSRAYQQGYRTKVDEILTAADEPLGLLEIGVRSTPDGKRYSGNSRWLVHLALLDSHLHASIRRGEVEQVDGPRYQAAR